MVLVLDLDATQDVHGHLGVGLFHSDGLEPPLERRVTLHVLAVVVQRGRADALDLTAGQGRLQDIGSVHGAFRGSGSDQGVDFVDEEHAIAGGLDFLNHLLQPLFELASVFGAGDQGAHVKGDQALALQSVRDVAR